MQIVMNNRIEKLLKSLIDENKFTCRRSSWTACNQDYFFKIPRKSLSVKDDIVNPEAVKAAHDEYNHMVFLNRLDNAVLKPLAIMDACIVMPTLTGNSIIDESKRGNAKSIQAVLEEGIALCARLHRYSLDLFEEIPTYDYKNNPFLHPTQDVLSDLESHPKTIVVRGFEIRNFKQDSPNGRLKFFDPHFSVIGAPEEDLSRYLVSILMLNWGKNINCLVFRKFKLAPLLETYQSIRNFSLNFRMLSYMFRFNIAMRRFYALESTKEMPHLKRLVAKAYLIVFFKQIDFWRNANGI